ncbi:hypothetical protein NP590_06575 [Methylomonas sp. SURF-2]|uniref:Uncharacterized protein n=1 Tax=Methylomonas subterranea TaxID=2952225 RepID=A0ABT1TEP7_9GAMM|nr:hypothetical protein [Methylomonas sp. SURF-2]MCQ8103764.1 hypothetical protein [Methylomonas sp. SURF-2]
METYYEQFDIVSVFEDFCLIDPESYQRKYRTADGQPLAAGYYVVNWPEHISSRRFDEQASFNGPHLSRHDAQSAGTRMLLSKKTPTAMTPHLPLVTSRPRG